MIVQNDWGGWQFLVNDNDGGPVASQSTACEGC